MYLLAGYVALVGCWTVAADMGAAHGLPLRINGVFVGDKVVHFLVVGLFAVVLARAIRGLGVRPAQSLLSAMALAAVLATVEELTNLLTPHRGFSVLDILANYSGILVLSGAGWAVYLARQSPDDETAPQQPVVMAAEVA